MAKFFDFDMLNDYLFVNPAKIYAVCSTLGDKTQVTLISQDEIRLLAKLGKFHGGCDGVPRIRRMSTKTLDEALGKKQHKRFTFHVRYDDIEKDVHGTRAYTIERMIAKAIKHQGHYAHWIGGLRGSNSGKIADIRVDEGAFIEVKCIDGRFNVNEKITHEWLTIWEDAEAHFAELEEAGIIVDGKRVDD